jgi:phosphatidylethanolamine-binding protein (PEBP) family uncharacterized protein
LVERHQPVPAVARSTTGSCPPSGTHHYRFAVYALDAPLQLRNGAGTGDALPAIGRHAIAQGRVVGLFTAD